MFFKIPSVDADGYAECPDCGKRIKCGPGGIPNLDKRHRGTGVCNKAREKRDKSGGKKMKDASIFSFLRKKPAPVPSTVSAPPLIQLPLPRNDLLSLLEPSVPLVPVATENSVSSTLPATHIITRLRTAIAQLPSTVPEGNDEEPLAAFSGDPSLLAEPDTSPDELWEEVLNGMMKRHLGWGPITDTGGLVRRGKKGLDGLLQFVEYFVLQRNVDASLFEGKLTSLMDVLDAM